MKKILVPIDFSRFSQAAVSYAIGLATDMQAEVVLLYAINSNPTPSTLKNWMKLEEEMVDQFKQNAEVIVKAAKKDGFNAISYQHGFGFPVVDVIKEFVEEHHVDLIVMGTRGATGMKKILLGSNAVSVIDKSPVPVIVVPEDAHYKTIKQVVYATDLQNLTEEAEAILPFVRPFGATLHVLHIAGKDSGISISEVQNIKKQREQDLIVATGYSHINVQVIKSDDIADAINNYAGEHRAELLILFTHRKDFFEKLFGKSVTHQLAFHNHLPLLTFN